MSEQVIQVIIIFLATLLIPTVVMKVNRYVRSMVSKNMNPTLSSLILLFTSLLTILMSSMAIIFLAIQLLKP